MEDKYAELRAALEAGPTPGPWAWDDDSRIATVASVSQYRIGPDYETSGQATYEFHADCSVDAAYIAACSPDTIRALLAERDALWEALDELANGYAGSGWDIGLRQRLQKARAALAQGQEKL